MLRQVNLRRALLVGTAISFASVDLLHKSLAAADYHHSRSPFIALIMAGVIVALVPLVPRISSDVAAVGAGIACGGARGNLVSFPSRSHGVPAPLVIGRDPGAAVNPPALSALSSDKR